MYKLIIAYDGTPYGGWQIQPNSVSIQSLIEKALHLILRKETPIIGSGRTDAGVHAKGQVAHFSAEEGLDLFKLRGSLNGILPPDIRILKLETVPDSFHARYSAVSKEYHYHLHLDAMMDPFRRLYALHVQSPLDLELMRQGALRFVGTHDFTSFANEGGSAKDPVRTIFRLDICNVPGGVRLEFEGNGFLYKMVRNITGTLLDVARGKLSLEELDQIFAAKDRSAASAPAPPHGLFLMKVDYAKSVGISSNDVK